MGSTVVLEKSQAIWRLTLNRPEKRNALNQDMKQALMSALEECDSIGPEVLIISGAGDTFCAGQDLNERKSQTDFDLEASIRDFFAPLAMKIRQLECVTVASVSGAASGAGASIALLCDIVVASKDARFIQPFLKLGLIPDMGGTWVLPRLIGEARARGAILLGDPINGEEASSPFIGSPSNIAPRALASPISLGSTHVPPISGMSPNFRNGWINRASFEATTISHNNAMLAPAPEAAPETDATVTHSNCLIFIARGAKKSLIEASRSKSV